MNIKLVFSIALLVLSQNLYADSDDALEWSGFLTSVVAQTNERVGFDFGIGPEQDFSKLSRFGINASKAIDSKTDVLLQLVARGDRSPNFESAIDFALVNYRQSNNLNFRFGRQRTPAWLISEYVNVGYLYPWVLAPQEVYGAIPFSSLNGVSTTYSIPLNGTDYIDIDLAALGGSSEFSFSYKHKAQTASDVRTFGGSIAFRNDKFFARALYFAAHAELRILAKSIVDLSALNPALTNVELNFPQDFLLGWVDYSGLGLRYNYENIFVWSEYAGIHSRLIKYDRNSGYVTLGYRVPSLKSEIYVTNSRILKNETVSPTGLSDIRQTTNSIGFNFDLTSNLKIKAQVCRTDFPDAGYPSANHLDGDTIIPGVSGPKSVETYFLSLDSVF